MRSMLALFAALLTAPVAAQTSPPGALLAEACLGCHWPGAAEGGGIPGLTGRPAPELVTLMVAFRANERPGTIMGRVARGYSDAQIAAIATHLATVPR